MSGESLRIQSFARAEYIDTIPFAENTVQTLRTSGGLLPNDRFMSSLMLEFRGRLTMPAATGPSGVQADAHAAIIERVTISGFHRGRKQNETFLDLRGADLELKQRIYSPGTFIKTPTSISVTANATNDMVVQIMVPFTPQRMPLPMQAAYLLDAPNYDSLKLTIQWGSFKSVVIPGATAATWSAYGSASGTPELRVTGFYAMSPSRFAGFTPGRIWQYFQEVTGSPVTTTASQTRLFDIPKGFDIRSLILKTGVKATNTDSGNNSFATLTDYLTDIRVNLGLGKYIRRYLDGNALYADIAGSYNLNARIVGVNPIDFCQYGSAGEILSTRPLINGPTGTVDLYNSADVAGNANQGLVMLVEEWRYRPLGAF